ncbi:MAG: hypothetical protein ACREPV_01145 [Lysobacter sp.]
MTSVARFNALGQLPSQSEQQRKALVDAIDLEFGLPGMYLDLCNGAAANDGSVTLLSDRKALAPKVAGIKSALQLKYAVPSDSDASTDVANRIDQFFHTGMQEIDLGWTNLFRVVDMRGSNQSAFDINTGTFGISYKQRAPGEKTEIWRTPTGTTVPVPYLTYSAGAGVLDDWLQYNKWWTIEEVITEFRRKAWANQAENHYGLLTGLGASIDVAHIVGDDLGTETLNAAGASIYRGLENDGVSASTPLWIVTSPEKRGYVLKMLEATQGSLIVGYTNGQPISVTIAGVIATTYVAAADTGYYLVLPGRKLARGVWKDLMIERARDIYKRAEDMVGTMQYNAIVGDTAQVRRVKFA